MPFPLNDFPPELLGAILRFDDVSVKVFDLIKCGSLLLTSKLLRGVDYIVLRNEQKYSLPSIPKLLTSFLNLRVLKIYRHELPLENDSAITSSLLSQHSSIEELHLDFLNSTDSFLYTLRVMEILAADEVSKRLKELLTTGHEAQIPFPRLKKLALSEINGDHIESLSQLPPHLEGLKFRFTGSFDLLNVFLPSKLLQLHIESFNTPPTSFFTSLPPLLEQASVIQIDSRKHRYDAWSDVPKSLLSLTTTSSPHLTKDLALSLPPALTSFTFDGLFKTEAVDIFSILPRNLTSLRCERDSFVVSSPMLRALPRSLKHLYCVVDAPDAVQGDFPPGLISIESPRPSTVSVPSLPASLRTLYAHARDGFVQDSHQLPKNLLKLTMYVTATTADQLVLPSSLTSLICEGDATIYESCGNVALNTKVLRVERSFLFDAMPKYITSLDVVSIPLSFAALLPDHLLSLTVCSIKKDIDWDPHSKITIERALALRAIEAKDDMNFDENLAPTQYDEVYIGDLLPRSLTHLVVSNDADLIPANLSALSRFPKKLKTLDLAYTAVSASCLTHLPMAHLTQLRIKLNSLDTTLAKLLPRRLCLARIIVLSTESDDPELVYSLPVVSQSSIMLPPPHNDHWRVLHRDLGNALNSGDKELLAKLTARPTQ